MGIERFFPSCVLDKACTKSINGLIGKFRYEISSLILSSGFLRDL